MQAKFEFFEIVQVSKHSLKKKARGLQGAILGMAQSETGEWFYAVHLYQLNNTWSIIEEDLESTGKMDSRESFYSGDYSIQVRVNPDTLEGEIVTENDDGKGR